MRERPSLPKSVKKQLAKLIATAHERALRKALEPLAREFERWNRGSLSSVDLAYSIHKFDRGPVEKIYRQYTDFRSDDMTLVVAKAIFAGLLEETDVPAEADDEVQFWLGFMRRDAGKG